MQDISLKKNIKFQWIDSRISAEFSLSERDSAAHNLGLAVLLQERKQALAHQNTGAIRRHMHLNLAVDVDRRVGVGRFQNVAILLDDGRVPVDQFLGRAILLAIVAEQDLNKLDA